MVEEAAAKWRRRKGDRHKFKPQGKGYFEEQLQVFSSINMNALSLLVQEIPAWASSSYSHEILLYG